MAIQSSGNGEDVRLLVAGLAAGTAVLLLSLSQTQATNNLVELSGGGGHTCGLFEDGTLRCWGRNDFGQLGDGSMEPSLRPEEVSGGYAFAQVSAGLTHTCGVRADGVVMCWGENDGRLGNDSPDASAVPVEVCADDVCDAPLSGVLSIATGGSHSCAVLSDGTARCWGNNEDGQLGDGGTDDSLTPVEVAGLTDVTQVSLGTSSSCALTNGGAVWCWGSNSEGQIGDGRDCGMRCPILQQVVELKSGVVQISSGGLHVCALKAAGGVMCWGLNFDGQVGDGTENNIRTAPVDTIESGATAISAGGDFRGHTCALMDGGTLQCWGDNDLGQIGDGTTDDRYVPAAVPGLGGVVEIGAGDSHMCALTSSASLYCWGNNSSGQFGDGSLESRLSPRLVALSKNTPFVRGDANCDGEISSIDAALILQYTAGRLADLSCDGDANGNGAVDSIDAALVLQVTAGLLRGL